MAMDAGEIPLTVSVVEEEPAMTQPQDEQQAGNGLNSGLIILAAVALGAVRPGCQAAE